MIIISGSSNFLLSQNLANKIGSKIIKANNFKFPDGEFKVEINENLYNQDIVILQSTSKLVNDNLIELLIIADIAKHAGARTITAIIPYFGYSRQDKSCEKSTSISARLVMNLIKTSGVDQVITVDLHSAVLESFPDIKLTNILTTNLFVQYFSAKKYLVVSPDQGSFSRAKAVANKLGLEYIVLSKVRNKDGKCEISGPNSGIIPNDCLIIDDIVDSAETIISASNYLKNHGAKKVSVVASHGVFSNDALKKIALADFEQFLLTDTISNQNLPKCIKVLSIADLLCDELKKLKLDI